MSFLRDASKTSGVSRRNRMTSKPPSTGEPLPAPALITYTHSEDSSADAEVKKSRIVTLGLVTRADREWFLNDGQIPNVRGVRVALKTGHNPGEGNRWASRNGRVSPSPTRQSDSQLSYRCRPRSLSHTRRRGATRLYRSCEARVAGLLHSTDPKEVRPMRLLHTPRA